MHRDAKPFSRSACCGSLIAVRIFIKAPPGYEPDDLKELKSYGQHNVAVCAFCDLILPLFSSVITEKKLRKRQKSPRKRAFLLF